MTIFGIIWIILELFCFVKKDIRYITALTIFGMVFQCNNVINIGELKVGPQIISSIIFSFKIILQYNKAIKIPKKNMVLIITMLVLMIIAFISSYKNNILKTNYLLLTQLMSYILCFICMNIVSKKTDQEFIYNLIRRLTIFILIVGGIQLLITANIIPRLSIISQLLFNEKRGAVYYYHNNYYRITSTFMEPSYFSGFIVGALFYFISFKEKLKQNVVLIIAIGIEIILTFSSTAYGCLLVTGITYIVFSDLKLKNKIALVIIAMTLFAIMYYGFYGVLDKVIFSKGTSGSANKRNAMNNRAIMDFTDSPIYGLGYKNHRASSMVLCLLVELGISGLITYFLLIIEILKPIVKKKKYNEIYFATIAALIAQIIACPDLDLCTLWLWLYMVGLYGLKKSESEKGKVIEK